MSLQRVPRDAGRAAPLPTASPGRCRRQAARRHRSSAWPPGCTAKRPRRRPSNGSCSWSTRPGAPAPRSSPGPTSGASPGRPSRAGISASRRPTEMPKPALDVVGRVGPVDDRRRRARRGRSISVVVCAYNEERRSSECLASLEAATTRRWRSSLRRRLDRPHAGDRRRFPFRILELPHGGLSRGPQRGARRRPPATSSRTSTPTPRATPNGRSTSPSRSRTRRRRDRRPEPAFADAGLVERAVARIAGRAGRGAHRRRPRRARPRLQHGVPAEALASDRWLRCRSYTVGRRRRRRLLEAARSRRRDRVRARGAGPPPPPAHGTRATCASSAATGGPSGWSPPPTRIGSTGSARRRGEERSMAAPHCSRRSCGLSSITGTRDTRRTRASCDGGPSRSARRSPPCCLWPFRSPPLPPSPQRGRRRRWSWTRSSCSASSATRLLFAAAATPPAGVRKRRRYRAVVAVMHVMQPFARFWGRCRRTHRVHGAVHAPEWYGDRSRFLQDLEVSLRSRRCAVRVGPPTAAWDLEAVLGPFVSARITTAVTWNWTPHHRMALGPRLGLWRVLAGAGAISWFSMPAAAVLVAGVLGAAAFEAITLHRTLRAAVDLATDGAGAATAG